MIERLARGYEADPELRRDLVQEIHAALWRSFAIFEGQCAEKSWVHRIAHNVGVTHMMTRRRERKAQLVGLEQIAELPTATIPSTAPASARCRTGCLRDPPAAARRPPGHAALPRDLTAAGDRRSHRPVGLGRRGPHHRLKALLAEPIAQRRNAHDR
jgi:RNA polymerase sigma-70 factor (ECF subfamily)